ncbi:MAG: hypothetical protein ACODAE_08200 [Gemmatimonadota bacterium]
MRTHTRRSTACALLACAPGLLLAAGCAENATTGPTGSEDPTASGPAYISLIMPAIQSAAAAARTVQLSGINDGTSKTFMISERLHADGTAHGLAVLADPEDPSDRVVYRFRRGRLACEGGVPVAHLSGTAMAHGQAHSFQIVTAGIDAAGGGHRDDIDVMSWTWTATDPGGRAGQHFVTEVRHYLISDEVCTS